MSIKKLNEAFPKSLKPATRYHQLPQELMFRETIQLDSDLSNNELSPESDLELDNELGLDDALSLSADNMFLEPSMPFELSSDEDVALDEELDGEDVTLTAKDTVDLLKMSVAKSKLNDMFEEMEEYALEHLEESHEKRKKNRLSI